ncbi:Phosphoserine aminotransferase [Coccomyxa sp. Obi]|nr:Phosphoserine aminotransferase [Coccomyxa sp. Obi]
MEAPANGASKTQEPYGRVYNFSAGPAVLPLPVLEEAQADLLSWKGSGMSVMEMSHRGPEFMRIIEEAESDLRALLSIPDNYKVLFLQGGATQQFAALPLNLSKPGDTVDYIVTGSWSKKAAEEAGKYANVNIVAKGDNKSVPARDTWKLTPGAAYVHYCDNETIQGVEFKGAPDVGDATLVADMSSNFCSKPVDVSKYGLIYAGAQKNIGPAGVVVVIVREDLVGNARPETPVTLNFKEMEGSMYNTPPCWSIYVCGLVFKHLLAAGGLPGVKANNDAKAKLVYDAIESSSGFYSSPVEPSVRSNMNIPFTIPSSPNLEKAFVSEASKQNMVQLKGHRSVGGMRASVYNSMPLEGAKALAAFMQDFASRH